MDNTKLRARTANWQILEVQGVSKGLYLKLPNISKIFFVKPLVVHNLSCDINLGAQFNFETGFIPQKVMQDEDGRRNNFRELDRVRIQLHCKDVSHATLRKTLTHPEFLRCLDKNHIWPRQRKKGRVTPHTLHVSNLVQQENRQEKEFMIQ